MIYQPSSLVTGAAGFIGSNLVDQLIKLGHKVIAIDDESGKYVNEPSWNDKAFNYKLDISNYHNTKSLYKNIDYVFHLAAEARIQPSLDDPLGALETNVLGTATVLKSSYEAGVKRVIFSSSSSIYGNNITPNIETQNENCLNPYSISKLTGEKLCKMYTDLYGLKTIILRYFNVYGNRQPPKGKYAPVIGLFDRQRKEGVPLTVVGDGSQKRDFTNVYDVVEANILAAIKDIDEEYYGEVFNVGYGKNYSILDIAKMISDNIEFIPERLGEAKETLADNSKIKRVLGWTPKISLESYLKDFL